MKFLKTIDQLSYKTVISIGLMIAVLFSVPIGVYLNSRTESSYKASYAAYIKPTIQEKTLKPFGHLPTSKPRLGRVFPWVGKEGDIVWIQGSNFGDNPRDRELKVGSVLVENSLIDLWEDDIIQFYLPEGVKQGASVSIRIGEYPVINSLPIIIYDKNTKIKLIKNNDNISLKNPSDFIKKAIVWTGDDEIPTKKTIYSIDSSSGFIFNTKGLPLLSILLIDDNNSLIPYYVDPIEFGF